MVDPLPSSFDHLLSQFISLGHYVTMGRSSIMEGLAHIGRSHLENLIQLALPLSSDVVNLYHTMI